MCLFDPCAGFPNALTYFQVNPLVCMCVAGFQWDATRVNCRRNCALVANSDGTTLANNIECSCNPTFVWNSTSNTCVADPCSSISFALTINTVSPLVCNCQSNFVWSSSASACRRNCAGVANSPGTTQADNNKCNCNPNYGWNAASNTCTPTSSSSNSSPSVASIIAASPLYLSITIVGSVVVAAGITGAIFAIYKCSLAKNALVKVEMLPEGSSGIV